jgi:hypothetical protein
MEIAPPLGATSKPAGKPVANVHASQNPPLFYDEIRTIIMGCERLLIAEYFSPCISGFLIRMRNTLRNVTFSRMKTSLVPAVRCLRVTGVCIPQLSRTTAPRGRRCEQIIRSDYF